MIDIHDPRHPIWPLLRTTIFMLTLTAILWLNASEFDETELRTIISVFLGALGIEGVSAALTAKRRE